ncbi:MAG: sulfurtransferase [Desulfobacterales bacterium]|nr:sulfurtransferase [Desulfobacterales bacterium]
MKPITAEALRAILEGRDEAEYLLIDVRQPAEYEAGHIPGALLIPVLELESRLFSLPEDRDLVFYCHFGGRSLAAAFLATDAEVTVRDVYHLQGGILAWKGKKLTNFPRIQVFETGAGIEALLYTAMDLEKGAWRFYRAAMDKAADHPIFSTLSELSEAEAVHARAVYKHWASTQKDPPPFEDLFSSLAGDILEGGESLSSALERLEALSGDWCLGIIELALHIEYCAYDLYRTAAETSEDGGIKGTLLSVAQAEKSHMRMLTRGIGRCRVSSGAQPDTKRDPE